MGRTYLTRKAVVRRMKRGDLPTQGGGYSSALYFDDGARTTSDMGWRLVKAGIVVRPTQTSVHARYTLGVWVDNQWPAL